MGGRWPVRLCILKTHERVRLCRKRVRNKLVSACELGHYQNPEGPHIQSMRGMGEAGAPVARALTRSAEPSDSSGTHPSS